MINVAIIGTGNISAAHINGYLAFPERCKITALVDIYPEKAEKKKTEYGLDAKVYSSHKDILEDPSIDLVSVCTPPYCHAEIAIDFLNSGKNVIVEKPMAPSLEECDEMIAARDRSGKLLSAVAQNRFRTSIMNLKKALDSGLIGRVLHAQIDSLWWRGHCYYDLWWRGTWEKEGGGCTLNHAVHQIDMLAWMMGLPKSVIAMLSNAAHDNSEVEDVSIAALQYEGGGVAQVTSSVVHHGGQQGVIFQGENARISVPWEVSASIAKPNGFPDPNPELEQKLNDFYGALPVLEHEGHEGQIDNVLTALETGSKPLISGEDGRRTIELITAIYKAGAEHKQINFPVEKDDIFYKKGGITKMMPHFYEKTASVIEQDGGPITVGNYKE